METMGRIALYVVGLALVVAAVWVLFTQTPLSTWVPLGVVAALILLILGIALIVSGDRLVEQERRSAAPGYGAPPTRRYAESDANRERRDRPPRV